MIRSVRDSSIFHLKESGKKNEEISKLTVKKVCSSYFSHPPPPSLHQCLLFRTTEAYSGESQKPLTQQHFPFILTSFFIISTPFSIALTFFSILMVIKLIAKNVS